MLKSQGVPAEQIDMLVAMIEKNPELFKTIASEIQEKIKGGMSQMEASQKVMEKYEEDLKKLKQ
jgi:predicted secreted protein